MTNSTAHDVASPTIVWVRQDLRLADHPAFAAAARDGGPVFALFILDDETPGRWRLGGASRWWLHHSLHAFGEALAARGSVLVLRRGRAEDILPEVAREAKAAAVRWTRQYEPYAIARDTRLKEALKAMGVRAESHDGATLVEPWRLKTSSGTGFRVYSPFARALKAHGIDRDPSPAPDRLVGPRTPPRSDRLEDWGLLPTKPDWAGGLREAWRPGEAGAEARLSDFLLGAAKGYAKGRNIPGRTTTSRLSPHLHFGEISPVQIWAAVEAAALGEDGEKLLAELIWRDFSQHLLFQVPDLPQKALRAPFDRFPWRDDPDALEAWRRGRTGYPIVDAGMRELWVTGWMHNRVRMVTASFLIKHLMIDWREGQDWFWDTLVDADLANNAASWQWVAGSGADAAPYFRIFNPVSQGETYDPDGAYVRRWVPELARLPNEYVHRPWEAPSAVLTEAGTRLGETYPAPIVDHAVARKRALAAYEDIRGTQ